MLITVLDFVLPSSNDTDLLSSDKKIEISSPYNPVHLTHVGYNLDTGEFTVRMRKRLRLCSPADAQGISGAPEKSTTSD